jgi:transposase
MGAKRSQDEALSLESLEVGVHPLIEPLLERLGIRELLEEALPRAHPRAKLAPLDSALVLIRNFTLCRHPLYGVSDWARRMVPEALGLQPEQMSLLNDDRLGRTLDKLFKMDRRSVVTRLIVHMATQFGVDLSRLHNDSTTVTFSGRYEGPASPEREGRAARITYGYNKDHRPDLKQLVWSLTVTADGAVPVHYNVFDGNITDDKTHITVWKALREIVGHSDFLYVADSKLCTRQNMRFIAARSGRFITVLPRSRREDGRFKEWLVSHVPEWELIWERASTRRPDDPPERFEALTDPQRSAEGYRLVWYRSSEKWKRDERARDNAIGEARWALHRLGERVGRRGLKTQREVRDAVDKVIGDTGTQSWIRVDVLARQHHDYRQDGPGRPGKNTQYVRETTTVYKPTVYLDHDAIERSAAADGVFPLLTNVDECHMSALDLLQTYKYQAFVEKRHEQLKTAVEVTPVNFKTPERIEAYLFVYFIAVTVHALLERQVRQAMAQRELRSIALYPEERACRKPTADKLLGLFEHVRRQRLLEHGQSTRTFWDPLTDVQRLVLELLGISTTAYGQ